MSLDAVARQIFEEQASFARARELEVDQAGCVRDVDANLHRPLTPAARSELAHLLGRDGKPGPLQRVDSTQALVCNVFDAWRERAGVVAAACGADPASRRLVLSPQLLRTSRDDESRRVDVRFEGGRPAAVLASFAEPYGDVVRSAPDPRAFDALPSCRLLAEDLRHNPGRFSSLPVGAILERVADLSNEHGVRGFQLILLWWERPGRAALAHRSELERLRMRVGGEVDLETRTWEQLVAELLDRAPGEVGYFRYLTARYFSG